MVGRPSPCVSCKLRHRLCPTDCIFARFFRSEDRLRSPAIHKVFGASKVSKWLKKLKNDDERAAAMRSLLYEAIARKEDPVYGCAGVISRLQSQIKLLQSQVAEPEAARGLYDMYQAQIPHIQNHEAVQVGKGKEITVKP